MLTKRLNVHEDSGRCKLTLGLMQTDSGCKVPQTIGKNYVLVVDPMRTIIVGRFRLGRLKESIYMNREVKIPRQAKHLGSAILDP